ncbi:MAG: Long-chain-fatty-acid--CoA ligase FadD15 [Proteobacteria bacterium]|nr:Long-chain-fatty-acid--CoA ligase FadD15 [Pseudomonadota bacterium]
MSVIIAALRRHAAQAPRDIAVQDAGVTLSYARLLEEVELLAGRLRKSAPRVLGLLADNSAAWAVADLAALAAGITIIPLPLFFSASQIAHVIGTAGIDQVLTDQPARLAAALQRASLPGEAFRAPLQLVRLDSAAGSELPAGTGKVTFTSGTTGEPKGVCLGLEEMETVAESLRLASAATRADRHLCLLPLATLLENIGGLYTPLLAGATICLPGLAEVGLAGSSGLDVGRLLAALGKWQASSAIMVPQMLQAVVTAGQAGAAMPQGLRYLAVGGAPVAGRLLADAQALGLPVFEGYGLSECASVVAVNRPTEQRPGSVGRPLPHLRLAFAEDGEILIHDVRWRGYLGEAAGPAGENFIATGDLGHLDDDGYLYLSGRKKNIFITSFGRNVAPEWVERELVSRFPILQAAVFGEARPFNSAVIVAHPVAAPEAIAEALAEANRQLPDYARVTAWVPAKAPFTASNGMATANGRLRRNNIFGAHAEQLANLYQLQN